MKRLSVLTLLAVAFVLFSSDLYAYQGIRIAAGQSSASSAWKVIDVNYTDVTLEDALRDVAARTGLKLTYAQNILPAHARVTYSGVGLTADQVLANILKGTGLRAVRVGEDRITVVRQAAKTSQSVITGKISDAKTGKGVTGATISLDNEAKGVVSDEDGAYRVVGVSAGAHTLVVRLVGYAKQTRSVMVGEGATVTVDFKLEPSANVLDQVVVTGTVTATELKAVPNAITVITAKQIEERGITRIDQLFRGDVPGLFAVNQGSADDAALDEVLMFSRGATALTNSSAGTKNLTNPIKTYIDGVEMADSKYLSQIDPSSIERIEILTGPQASTIYGANAINGVMQIFTKRGMGSRPQLTVNLTSGFIKNNFSSRVAPSYITDTRFTGVEGKFSYNIGGSWAYAGSWTPGKQTQRLSLNGGGRLDLGKIAADFSARDGYTKNRQEGHTSQTFTNLQSTGIWIPIGSAGGNGVVAAAHQTLALDGHTIGFSLSYHPLSWWSHEVILGSDAATTESIKSPPAFTNRGDTSSVLIGVTTRRVSQSYNSTMQFPIASIAKLNFTFGGDHWYTDGGNYTVSRAFFIVGSLNEPSVELGRPAKNTGAFIQGQFGMWDALFFTYGVRADWNPSFGEDAKVKPGRYGVSYTRDMGSLSLKLRGSYGRSIRPPGTGVAQGIPQTDFSSITDFGPYYLYLPNPDLGPEHQSGGEGGLEIYLGNHGSLVVTRFNQTVDNLISSIAYVDSVRALQPGTPPNSNCDSKGGGVPISFDAEGHCFRYQNQYINVGSIRNQGWETQSSVNIGLFTVRGTYSWVKSRIIGVTPKYKSFLTGISFEVGRSFDYLPEHTWALGLAYSQSTNTVSLSINGTGMRYVGNTELDLLSSPVLTRLPTSRPRFQSLTTLRRPMEAGYATADLNASHRFSSRLDGTLQIKNLTDYYANDFSANYATAGRETKAGLRMRF